MATIKVVCRMFHTTHIRSQRSNVMSYVLAQVSKKIGKIFPVNVPIAFFSNFLYWLDWKKKLQNSESLLIKQLESIGHSYDMSRVREMTTRSILAFRALQIMLLFKYYSYINLKNIRKYYFKLFYLQDNKSKTERIWFVNIAFNSQYFVLMIS